MPPPRNNKQGHVQRQAVVEPAHCKQAEKDAQEANRSGTGRIRACIKRKEGVEIPDIANHRRLAVAREGPSAPGLRKSHM